MFEPGRQPVELQQSACLYGGVVIEGGEVVSWQWVSGVGCRVSGVGCRVLGLWDLVLVVVQLADSIDLGGFWVNVYCTT